MNYGKRTCVLVLGMHRSGTSVLAGVLNILGVSFGDKLVSAGMDNVKGYFEHSDFLQLNRAFFVSFGLDEDGRAGELPIDWMFDERTADFKEKIKTIIAEQFGTSYIFGIKDPRISILLPAYIAVLRELGVEIRAVVSERGVAEVTASLEKRNGTPIYESIRAYEYFYRIINQHTKDVPTVRISYNDVLHRTQDVVNQLIRSVHYSLRPYVDVAAELASFIEPALKHHDARDQDLLVSLAQHARQSEKELLQLRTLREQDMGWWQERVDSFIRLVEDAQRERDDMKRKQMFMESALRELERAHEDARKGYESEYNKLYKHITHLDSLLRERDAHVHQLNGSISKIERSFVWKMVKGWDTFLALVLPKDTYIRRGYDSLIRFNQHVLNDWLPEHVVRFLKKVPREVAAEQKDLFWREFAAIHPSVDVLFVNHEETRTGAPRIVYDVAEFMKKTHSVAMVSLRRGSMGHEFAQTFAPVIYPEDLYGSLSEYDQAVQVLERVRPKVVYVNSIVSHQFARAAKDLGIKVVFHVHELDIAFQIVFSKREREQFKYFADAFIAVSKPVYQLLVENLGCPKDQVHLIHEFVSHEKIIQQATAVDSDLIQRELDVVPGEVVILGLGTFIYRKGADLFMKMAKTLKEKGLPVRFVWIGSRPFKEPFMADFDIYAPYFSFLQEKVNPFPYVAAADIVVLPSREDPFPLVVLEAMALKKPTVVFSDAGGIQEAVKDAGMVIPHFDVLQFQHAIEYLVLDAEKRDVLGSRAQHYQQEYDSAVVLPRIERLVGMLLSEYEDDNEVSLEESLDRDAAAVDEVDEIDEVIEVDDQERL